MPEPIPPSQALLPPASELRFRLAVALREVDLLRRLLRVTDYVARYGHLGSVKFAPTDKVEVRRE
jgi:hypothetical protein